MVMTPTERGKGMTILDRNGKEAHVHRAMPLYMVGDVDGFTRELQAVTGTPEAAVQLLDYMAGRVAEWGWAGAVPAPINLSGMGSTHKAWAGRLVRERIAAAAAGVPVSMRLAQQVVADDPSGADGSIVLVALLSLCCMAWTHMQTQAANGAR